MALERRKKIISHNYEQFDSILHQHYAPNTPVLPLYL